MVKVATVTPTRGTFDVPEKLTAWTATAAGATISVEPTWVWLPPGLVRTTVNGYWPARSYTFRETTSKKASPPEEPSATMSALPNVPSPKLIVAE